MDGGVLTWPGPWSGATSISSHPGFMTGVTLEVSSGLLADLFFLLKIFGRGILSTLLDLLDLPENIFPFLKVNMEELASYKETEKVFKVQRSYLWLNSCAQHLPTMGQVFWRICVRKIGILARSPWKLLRVKPTSLVYLVGFMWRYQLSWNTSNSETVLAVTVMSASNL